MLDRAKQVEGVSARVFALLATDYGVETNNPAMRFDSLDMDSLDFIAFINLVEDQFGIEIPKGLNLETIGDLIRWLECPA